MLPDGLLADGSYETLVIDAEASERDGTIVLDLTITTGSHKGDVVTVLASGLTTDPITLLGLPATLVVADGEPHVRMDA